MTIQNHDTGFTYRQLGRVPTHISVFPTMKDAETEAWRLQVQAKKLDDRSSGDVAGVPRRSIELYAAAMTFRAAAKELEPEYWYVSSKDFRGVWGDGDSREDALEAFRSAAVDWVALKLEEGDDDLPEIGGAPLTPLLRA